MRVSAHASGLGLAVLIGVGFTVLRAHRYELAIAAGFSELPLQLALLRTPEFVTDPYVRETVLGMLPPAARVVATLAGTMRLDVTGVEHLRLLAINVVACAAVWALAWVLFRDRLTALVSVAMVVGGGLGYYGLGWYWTLGNWAEWHPLATAIGVGVLAALYRGGFVAAGAGVGVLTWVHPTHAALMGLLAVVAAAQRRERWREALGGAVVAAVISVPVAWQAVERLPLVAGFAVDATAWWDLMRARKGHHLFPLAWSARTWAAAGTVVLGGWLARHVVRRHETGSEARESLTTGFLSVLFAVCLIGIVGSELVPTMTITQLGLMRASGYIEAILALYVCRLVVLLVGSGAIAAVAGFALAVGVVWIDVASRPGRLLLVAVPLLASIRLLRVERPAIVRHRLAITAVALLMVATMAHVWVQALPSPALAGSHRIPQLRAWKEVQEWARAATPPGSVFVTPPDWCGFETFSERRGTLSACDVGRSVYAARWASEEIRRMQAYRTPADGGGLVPRAFSEGWMVGPGTAAAQRLLEIAAAQGATYAVVPRPGALDLPVVYENGGFTVFRLAPAG